ncbi:MAG: hypothetical protein HZB42_10845 [Sphingobacteriales bacterium]|nr:hypothetical protein [Sphingobacteriales bacterium]
MKTISTIVVALLVVVLLAACNKNYYSGSGKGGKNCGCPSHKGMSGY